MCKKETSSQKLVILKELYDVLQYAGTKLDIPKLGDIEDSYGEKNAFNNYMHVSLCYLERGESAFFRKVQLEKNIKLNFWASLVVDPWTISETEKDKVATLAIEDCQTILGTKKISKEMTLFCATLAVIFAHLRLYLNERK